MKMLRLGLRLILLATVGLTGCSTNWTPAQRQASVPASIRPVTYSKNYYNAPQRISPEAAGTAGFITGAATGLIGGAVGMIIINSMQNSYEKDHAATFAQIKNTVTAADLNGFFKTSLQKNLETISHFKGQINDTAAANFNVTVNSFALSRLSGSSPDHSVAIVATFQENSATGENLFTYTGVSRGHILGSNSVHAPFTSYAANPTLLRSHIGVVIDDLSKQCAVALKKKLDPPRAVPR